MDYGVIDNITSEYNKEILNILNEKKYNRNSKTGQIQGYGKKLLP
jgi:hypothetical protein